ncbi:MAG: transcriptional repressor [Chlamydiota bacterium]
MRTSTYRNTILATLKEAHLLSIADICKSIPQVNFSTVFRNLEQLCKEGLVKRLFIDKDYVLYESINPHNPHDHFFCTTCHMIQSLAPQKNFLKQIPGIEISDVLVRGICESCKK